MILLLKTCQNGFDVTFYRVVLRYKIMFASLYARANSKEIFEQISFPSFSEKCRAFLLRFKANLKKVHGYPHFSLWIPIALTKIYFFHMVLIWYKNLSLYLVDVKKNYCVTSTWKICEYAYFAQNLLAYLISVTSQCIFSCLLLLL